MGYKKDRYGATLGTGPRGDAACQKQGKWITPVSVVAHAVAPAWPHVSNVPGDCLGGRLWRPSEGRGRGCLVELVVALITYCVSYLPRKQGPLGSRHGPGASQEGMNVLLCYPESCLREVAQDFMLIALYVARCAWALTLHPSQAWVELSFYHVVTVYGAASVHWESLLFHASGCQLCHLGGSLIKKGWRGPAVYAQCPPSFILV